MATTLYLRDSKDSSISLTGPIPARDLLATRGAVATTGVVNSVASATQIIWTKTAAGETLSFITGRAPVGGFSLSGAVTISCRALESNGQANCGLQVTFFKRTSAGVESLIQAFTVGAEFGTSEAVRSVSTTFSGTTAFAEDDRLYIAAYIIPAGGTMGGGRTCTIFYDGPTSGASGDSFVTINPTVTFKAEAGGNKKLTADIVSLRPLSNIGGI